MLTKRLIFALLALISAALLGGPATAQDAHAPHDASDVLAGLDEVTATVVNTGFGDDVDRAAATWIRAVHAKPQLVSLRETNTATELDKQLRGRLKVLGDKTFSNREWRTYWLRQERTAGALAAALKAAKARATPDTSPVVERAFVTLSAWAALGRDKVENQDRYLSAIDTERDALEERLEAALEPENAEKATAKPRLTEEPSAYDRREQRLAELRHRIEWQSRKRRTSEMDRKLIKRQLASEAILLKALVTDVQLARRERDIASGQARAAKGVVAFASTWQQVADSGRTKVAKLTQEAQHGAARERARQLEFNLAKAQIAYRTERIAALEVQLADEGGFRTWLLATWHTLLDWLINSAWKMTLGLLALWIGIKFALYLIGRGVRAVIVRAEGDPDDPNDDDIRILTLADVFSGVARLTLGIVAALLALEIVGVNTGPLLGSVAILGLAVSFGSQNLVRDVVNGFFILMENQYAVGEIVDLGGKVGTVEQITIRSTWIRQANGTLNVVPNGSIGTVSNLTRDWNRAMVHIGVGYGADLKIVKETVNTVCEALYADPDWQPKLKEAPAFVGVTELGDSAVVVRIMGKCEPGQQWGMERELNLRLKLAFDAAGIEIPFPQRVMWNKPAA